MKKKVRLRLDPRRLHIDASDRPHRRSNTQPECELRPALGSGRKDDHSGGLTSSWTEPAVQIPGGNTRGDDDPTSTITYG
jgi:hypothetical protein